MRAEVLALGAAFFIASALVAGQFGLKHISPSAAALVTLPLMTSALWIIAIFQLDWSAWKSGSLALFIGAGLFFPGMAALLTYEANSRLGPAIVGALGNMGPLFAMPAAAILLGELPSFAKFIGMTVALSGAVLISTGRPDNASKRWALALLLLPLGSAAIRGLTQPIIKFGLIDWPSPLAAMLATYTTSLIVVTCVTLIRTPKIRGTFSRAGVLWFSGIALLNAAGIYSMYAALAIGTVVTVSALVATYPVVTLALLLPIRNREPMGRRSVAGVLLTVCGIIVLIGSR